MGEVRCLLRPEGGSDIFLSGESAPITYSISMGGAPSFNDLWVSEHVDRQIQGHRQSVGKPSKWSLIFEDQSPSFVEIKHLWLLGRGRGSGPYNVQYTLADRRYGLWRKRVDSFFNMTRVNDDFNRPSTKLVSLDVSILGKVGKFQFVPNTCRDISKSTVGGAFGGQFFAGIGPKNSINFDPWTALQAYKYLHSDNGWIADNYGFSDIDGNQFFFGTVQVSPRVKERKVILKDWNPRSYWRFAVDKLTEEARVATYVNPEGQFVIEDLFPDNSIFKGYGKYRGAGGLPIVANLQWDAPRDMSVTYPTYHEIRWDYEEQLAEKIATGKNTYGTNAGTGLKGEKAVPAGVIRKVGFESSKPHIKTPNKFLFRLENVLPMPQDVPARGIKAGQWVEVFEALDIWTQQAKKDKTFIMKPRNPASFAGSPDQIFSPPAVRRFLTTSGLGRLWMQDYSRPGFKNPILEARVSSIYQHFRRTFRILPEWIDHVQEIRTDVGSIFANVSRSRAPSPVNLDQWVVDSTLYRYAKSGIKTEKHLEGTGHIRNIEVDGKELFSRSSPNHRLTPLSRKPYHFMYDPITGQNVIRDNLLGVDLSGTSILDTDFFSMPSTNCRVSLIDPPRGVFAINFVPNFSGTTVNYMPGLVNPRTMPTSNANAIPGEVWYGYARTLPLFRLATILSIKFRSPNNDYRHVRFKASGSGNPTGSSPSTFSIPSNAYGPEWDVFSAGFEAYKQYQHKKVSWGVFGDTLVIEHTGKVANLRALQEFSESHFSRLYFRYMPRIIGEYSTQGWTGQMPVGHITQIRISLKASGALETTLVGSRPPVPPSLLEDMSDSTRNLIQRFEEGTRLDVV